MLRHLLTVAGFVSWAAIASAQSPPAVPPEAQTALERPLSPGAVALLLPHTSQPVVVERLARALRDGNPDVRAVAARVAFTNRIQNLVEPLAAALDVEQAASPAAEMVRALALMGGPAADDAAMKAIDRLGSAPAAAWVQLVGRTRPAHVLPRLTIVGAQAVDVLTRLARGNDADVPAAFAALPTTPKLEGTYVSLIERFDGEETLPPWPIVAPGLRGPLAARRAIARLLLHRRYAGDTLPPEAVAALDDLRAPASTTADPFLALTFELVRRRDHRDDAATALTRTIAALDTKAPIQGGRDPWLRRLTESEEKALRGRVYLSERKTWAPEVSIPPTAPKRSEATRSPVLVRTARPLTPRLIIELGELTGCPPAADQILAVQITFRPTGQVRQVNEPVGAGVERCARAARVVAALDVAVGSEPIDAEHSDLVMIGFRPDDADCPHVDVSTDDTALRPGSRVRAPRKIRNPQPVYPQQMQDARIQGVVLIEAIISAAGCVTDARVLRGPHTTLEAAAVATVSRWRYEPSLLDGKPIPIIMTVTVNFALQ